MKTGTNDTIKLDLVVNLAKEKTFEAFVEQFSNWWPKAYTWSGSDLQTIQIEARVNGKCFETGPFDFRLDWGRVLLFKPSEKVAFTWQISPTRIPEPNPDKASEVHIFFVAKGLSTVLKLEHNNFSNHGEGWKEYFEAMQSEQGWAFILQQFKAYCEK